MNFRNFAGFGKSFFSRAKPSFTIPSPPKSSFMTKMAHKYLSPESDR